MKITRGNYLSMLPRGQTHFILMTPWPFLFCHHQGNITIVKLREQQNCQQVVCLVQRFCVVWCNEHRRLPEKGFILLVLLIPKPHTTPDSAAARPNKNGVLIMVIMVPIEPLKTPTRISFAVRKGSESYPLCVTASTSDYFYCLFFNIIVSLST